MYRFKFVSYYIHVSFILKFILRLVTNADAMLGGATDTEALQPQISNKTKRHN